MASLAYLVLYLCLHACTARPLMVWDRETITQLQLSSKDVKTSIVRHSDKASDHGTNVMPLEDQKSTSVKEAENIDGKKIKISYLWKILHQATGTEIWKRSERSTLESLSSNAEKNASSKDNDTVEDIAVMDYALPHRKPPIHNKGT